MPAKLDLYQETRMKGQEGLRKKKEKKKGLRGIGPCRMRGERKDKDVKKTTKQEKKREEKCFEVLVLA
jgi:hypothetical protein